MSILEIENLEQFPFSISEISEYDKSESKASTRYAPSSKYPFIARDIAVWTPEEIDALQVENLIRSEAGELLLKLNIFDQFKKDGKISYAFHLVFQSFDKTLSDEEINKIMDKITSFLNNNDGWTVR